MATTRWFTTRLNSPVWAFFTGNLTPSAVRRPWWKPIAATMQTWRKRAWRMRDFSRHSLPAWCQTSRPTRIPCRRRWKPVGVRGGLRPSLWPAPTSDCLGMATARLSSFIWMPVTKRPRSSAGSKKPTNSGICIGNMTWSSTIIRPFSLQCARAWWLASSLPWRMRTGFGATIRL